MTEQEGKYNVKAAALMLGIQPGTLRAWERRYQMIAPERNASGYRLYTDEHIKMLRALISKVKQGFSISQAINFMSHSPSSNHEEKLTFQQAGLITSAAHQFYEALINFNIAEADEISDRLFSIYTTEKVLWDVFYPLILKIRIAYKSEVIINAQYHYAKMYLTTRVSSIIQSLPINHHWKVVIINQTGKEQDFQLLMLSFLLRREGMEVINTFEDFVEEEIEKILKLIHPDIIIFSCEEQTDLFGTLKLINNLALNHNELSIGLISNEEPRMVQSEKGLYSKFHIGQTPNEWKEWFTTRFSV
nr:MerR family transcriptional regulator [Neobacillus sp. Marseille-Q6967]